MPKSAKNNDERFAQAKQKNDKENNIVLGIYRIKLLYLQTMLC